MKKADRRSWKIWIDWREEKAEKNADNMWRERKHSERWARDSENEKEKKTIGERKLWRKREREKDKRQPLEPCTSTSKRSHMSLFDVVAYDSSCSRKRITSRCSAMNRSSFFWRVARASFQRLRKQITNCFMTVTQKLTVTGNGSNSVSGQTKWLLPYMTCGAISSTYVHVTCELKGGEQTKRSPA